MTIKVKVQGIHKDALLPHKATSGSAGFDFYALEDTYVHPINVTNSESTKIRTGISLAIPEGYVGLLVERSSLHGKGVTLANNIGVIDSDYRGEILIATKSLTNNTVKIEKGQRVAQLLIVAVPSVNLWVVRELDETVRNVGGFGSSG